MSTVLPNTFQTFNAYVDVAMQWLTGDEMKCLIFTARHILGWQDKINSRRGCISLTMFEHGYTDGKGNHYGSTGLSRPTIIKVLDELVRFGLLVKIGDPGPDGQEWELGTEINWEAMQQRKAEAKAGNRRKTAKARSTPRNKAVPVVAVHEALIPELIAALDDALVNATNQQVVNGTNQGGGKSHLPEVVNGTNQGGLMALTSTGKSHLLNQSHIQNHLQSHIKDSSTDDPSPALPSKKEAHQQLLEATMKTLTIGDTSYPLAAKYAQFLAGTTPERDSKNKSNGDWHTYRITPGMDAVEIAAFGLWLDSEYDGDPMRKPETLNDYAGRFRMDSDHDLYMGRARLTLSPPSAAEPAEDDDEQPATHDPTVKDRSAEMVALMTSMKRSKQS